MRRSLFNRIDLLGDCLNPILVRDLRRLRRSRTIEILTILVLTGMVVLYGAVFLILSRTRPDEIDRQFTTMILSVVPAVVVSFITLFTVFYPIGGILRERGDDPLLACVPLSAKDRVLGYLQISCLLAFFFCCLTAPFIVMAQLVGPISRWFVFLPIGLFFYNLSLFLFCLPFAVRATRVWELIVVYFGLYYIGSLPIQLPWIFVAIALGDLRPSVDPNSMILLFVALAILVVVGFGYTGYRLAIYHFANTFSVWIAALFNLAVYTLVSVALAVFVAGVLSLF